MKIIVRKMPQMVLDKSFEQIEGKYETCFAGNAMETFMKSVELSKDDNCLNMEDDIVLCKDFMNKVEEVVSKYPTKVISFFTLKDRPNGANIEKARTFCMNQCVYMPKWFNNLLLQYYPKWLKTERGQQPGHAYDYMMADLLSLVGEDYILYQPSLVQHMEMKSRIDPRRSTHRTSKTFKEE